MKRIHSLIIALVLGLVSWTALGADVLDINSATAEQLQAIKGVGKMRAAAIVEYRNEHGPFQSVDELANVPGIGDKILEQNRAMLKAEQATQQQPMEEPAMEESGEPPAMEEAPMEKPAQ